MVQNGMEHCLLDAISLQEKLTAEVEYRGDSRRFLQRTIFCGAAEDERGSGRVYRQADDKCGNRVARILQ